MIRGARLTSFAILLLTATLPAGCDDEDRKADDVPQAVTPLEPDWELVTQLGPEDALAHVSLVAGDYLVAAAYRDGFDVLSRKDGTVLWSGDTWVWYTPPKIFDDAIAMNDRESLTVRDLATGDERYSITLSGSWEWTVTDTAVIAVVAGESGQDALAAFDRKTGTELWQSPMDRVAAIVEPPRYGEFTDYGNAAIGQDATAAWDPGELLVAQGYADGDDYQMSIVDMATGDIRADYPMPPEIDTEHIGYSSGFSWINEDTFLFDNDAGIEADVDYAVPVFDLETGRLRQQHTFATEPVVNDGVLMGVDPDGRSAAIDLSSDTELWTDDSGDRPLVSTPDLLVTVKEKGHGTSIAAVEPGTGKQLWTFSDRGAANLNILVSGDRIFLSYQNLDGESTPSITDVLDLRDGAPIGRLIGELLGADSAGVMTGLHEEVTEGRPQDEHRTVRYYDFE